MLTTFLISLVAILLLMALMAVGVIAGRDPIKGSCGGLNKLGLRDGDCPVCGGNPVKCENQDDNKNELPASLAQDAMKK